MENKEAVTMSKDDVLDWLEEAKDNLANRSALPATYRLAFETAIQLIKEADVAYTRGYLDGSTGADMRGGIDSNPT